MGMFFTAPGSNAVENRRTAMTAAPVEPGECDRARAVRTVPVVAVHSRQPAPENMDDAKATMLEQISPTDRLEEGEAQKKKDVWHEIDRVLGESLNLSVRRVGNDS